MSPAAAAKPWLVAPLHARGAQYARRHRERVLDSLVPHRCAGIPGTIVLHISSDSAGRLRSAAGPSSRSALIEAAPVAARSAFSASPSECAFTCAERGAGSRPAAPGRWRTAARSRWSVQTLESPVSELQVRSRRAEADHLDHDGVARAAPAASTPARSLPACEIAGPVLRAAGDALASRRGDFACRASVLR